MNTPQEPRQLGVRLDLRTTQRVATLEKETGIDAVTVIKRALDAALDYFDVHGFIVFPLLMTPKHPLIPAGDSGEQSAHPQDPGSFPNQSELYQGKLLQPGTKVDVTHLLDKKSKTLAKQVSKLKTQARKTRKTGSPVA